MRALLVAATLIAAGCAAGERRFPLRPPMWRDADTTPVRVACRAAPTRADPRHVSCAPEVYESPLYWDGADNLFFRGLSEGLGLATSGESVNVSSIDEVPDSSWFQNRIGVRAMTPDEVARGACTPDQLLDPEHSPDGAWLIDRGKMDGSTPGFRVVVPGKGRFMVKLDDEGDEPERGAASTVIGTAVYFAAGYRTTCEQVLYARPSLFRLAPGLWSKSNFQPAKPFDQRALEELFAKATQIDGRVRLSASAWIPGYAIGPYRYEGTRSDDPNDVVAHEDRRELRAMRVLASWIDRFDAREANTFDAWVTTATPGPADASPGYVLHYQLDTSEALGSLWDWDELSRRLGYSYVLDWGDLGQDLFTLGATRRPWDTLRLRRNFGYFDAAHFVPDAWKSEYPNPAFSRMTERDAAWMARILAHFTRADVRALARAGKFRDPADTDFLAETLEARLEKILARYLLRLAPIGDLHVQNDALCGTDFAEMRGVRDASRFRFAASVDCASAPVARTPGGGVCVAIPRARDGRYVRVRVEDGVAQFPLRAYLYDTARELVLAGVERPANDVRDERGRCALPTSTRASARAGAVDATR